MAVVARFDTTHKGVVHASGMQLLQYIHGNCIDTEAGKTRFPNHPTKAQNPPNSNTKQPPIASLPIVHFLLQGCHCKSGPGAIVSSLFHVSCPESAGIGANPEPASLTPSRGPGRPLRELRNRRSRIAIPGHGQ